MTFTMPNTSRIRTKAPTKANFNALAIQCPPDGNPDTAEYCMVGEAPSSIEVLERKPFVGPAGKQLIRMCEAINIPRHRIYLTNACKAQLPGNKSDILWTSKGHRCADWHALQEALILELSTLRTNHIILLGATAMMLLLDDPKITSIIKYRGSHYKAEDFPHLAEPLRGKFIHLTFHPASSLYNSNPLNFWIIIADLQKVVQLADDPTRWPENPTVITRPSLPAVLQFYEEAKQHPYMGFDIEATPKLITCFAITAGKDKVMSVPLMNNKGSYWTPEEEVQIWDGLANLLGDPTIGIVCQNGMFDLMFVLRTMGIKSDNFAFDTMIAQHICYTDLPKGLDFLTSCYTYFPYYKDEGKQSHLSVIKDWDMYWHYNAKDAVYLLHIMLKLQEELEQFEALDTMNYSMALHKPLMEMEFNGILTDQAGIKEMRTKLQTSITEMQNQLDEITGQKLNINSPKQLVAYFYGTLGLKPYVNRKSGNPTCDAVALSRIARKNKGAEEARLILSIRKNYKMLSTYFNINVDADHKLRCSHKITGTVSGRIATEKTFFGTGANLQNQPYEFKKYLIPEPDHLLCEVDLAKAEAHVVAYLCQDANMMEAFISGVDVHTFNASKIFGKNLSEVTKHERSMGKRVVHASNYGMGPQTFSDNLAKDDTFMSQMECKALLTAYSRRFPGLHRWHKEIETEVSRTRLLRNLFGRKKRFLGMMNSALFRNAYSYIPQSTVAELLNRGTIKMANDPMLGPAKFDIDLLTTVHDSAVFQFKLELCPQLLDILLLINQHMKHEFIVKGRRFTIGLDAKIGLSWAGDKVVEIPSFTKLHVEEALHKLGV